ncbi:MAG: DUF6580 family putative transport protein [Ignavibacteriaceae bacterium]
MNKNLLNPKFLLMAGLILAAAFSRLIPHPPNFTAVGAIALFGGAYFSRKSFAYIVPVAAMLLSDLFIGFHPGMYAVYISFALIVLIGMTLRNNKKISRVFAASLAASVSFFIITNFVQWLTDPFYAKTTAGLVQCYTLAIPFFQYTVIGDLCFVGLMFGVFEIAKAKIPSLARIEAN